MITLDFSCLIHDYIFMDVPYTYEHLRGAFLFLFVNLKPPGLVSYIEFHYTPKIVQHNQHIKTFLRIFLFLHFHCI